MSISKTHIYLNNFKVIDYQQDPSIKDEDFVFRDIETWKNLPRGKSEVYYGDNLIHVLYGLKKYGYDYDNFGFPKGEWDTCISTIKENGECFHVTFFSFNTSCYCLIGSKQVHILISLNVPLEEQFIYIEKSQKQRVFYALKMARYFFDKCYSRELTEWIIKEGVTLVGEYINPSHYHIVKYDKENIRFFAITHPYLNKGWYTYLTPQESIEIFKKFNLDFVNYYISNTKEELEKIKQKYFMEDNCEGLVLYYLKDNVVTCIEKYKNKHYTILRTIRELFRNESGVYLLKKRLKNYHIPLSQEEQEDYVNFFIWVKQQENVTLFSTELYNKYKENPYIKTSDKTIILMIGIPGSGKTSLGCQLMLNFDNCVYIDQDMFQSDKKKLDEKFKALLKDDTIKYIIHGKCNTSSKTREDTLKYITTEKVIKVMFEPNIEGCLERIKDRKFHNSLKYNEKTKGIISSFFNSFEESKDSITLPFELSVKDKLKILNPNATYYPNFVWCNFIAIKINIEDIKEFIPIEFKMKVPVLNLHITLIHSTDFNNYKDLALYWNNKINDKITVLIESICMDDNITAIKVKIDEKVVNIIPHITLYKKYHKIQNVYSNTMLLNPTKEVLINKTIEGIVERY